MSFIKNIIDAGILGQYSLLFDGISRMGIQFLQPLRLIWVPDYYFKKNTVSFSDFPALHFADSFYLKQPKVSSFKFVCKKKTDVIKN